MIREQLEQIEEQTLCKNACLSKNSKGRKIKEEKCDYRTDFQRDRDRIIHCNSFRRLKHKTQVFLSPMGDHYRTRLTHTLEVSQIARTISRALRLNEDLTEAIALAHDLGHTPFGHAGERALSYARDDVFRHNIQSVRVVDHIEKDGEGLNLTFEVKNGIACHSDNCPDAITLEGKVVRIADKIAYINHDIEDAIRGKILRESDLPYDCIYVLGRGKSARISTIIKSIIENSDTNICMSKDVSDAHNRLKEFMFENVYTNSSAKSEEGKAEEIIIHLYRHFLKNINKLPDLYIKIADDFGDERAVCDYISGMTDIYAIDLYKEIFLPKFW